MKLALVLKNLLIIFLLFGMIWWLHLQNRTDKQTQPQTKPQEYMAALTVINYTETGKPKEKLQADYWAFVPNFGKSDLRKPHVTVYKSNGDVWYLAAQQAMAWHPTMGDKITQLDMLGNVTIERSAANNATPTLISTEEMQYYPATETLTSKVYIAMQQPGLTISGVGMAGYLDKNWIELHDQIKTVYQTKHN